MSEGLDALMKYLTILFLVPMIANTDIYKYTQAGKLIFSDIPCSHDAEKIKIATIN
jgi:hypothetical protein